MASSRAHTRVNRSLMSGINHHAGVNPVTTGEIERKPPTTLMVSACA